MTQEEIDKVNDYYKSIDFPYTLLSWTDGEGFTMQYHGVVQQVLIKGVIVND